MKITSQVILLPFLINKNFLIIKKEHPVFSRRRFLPFCTKMQNVYRRILFLHTYANNDCKCARGREIYLRLVKRFPCPASVFASPTSGYNPHERARRYTCCRAYTWWSMRRVHYRGSRVWTYPGRSHLRLHFSALFLRTYARGVALARRPQYSRFVSPLLFFYREKREYSWTEQTTRLQNQTFKCNPVWGINYRFAQLHVIARY